MSERERIEQAIEALEAQRLALGDQVVETTLAVLRANLAALEPTERRSLVTVLFADVSGFTAISARRDAEDVQDLMHRLWEQLDRTILGHGGMIDKHIGDRVMAVWGVNDPREDNPEQACRAALDMQARLAALREEHDIMLSMRIGINTGLASVGHIASTGEMNIIGDTVNLASGLEQVAQSNEILISKGTFGQVRGLFEVEPKPPLKLKGRAEVVEAYGLVRALERAFHMQTRGLAGIMTRTVGREVELTTLQTAFHRAAAGEGLQWVTLSGVAGIGKSRLLTDLEGWGQALPEPAVVFKARAWPQSTESPYAMLRNLVAFRCQISDNDPLAVARKKLMVELTRVLGERQGQQAAVYIGQLIGFDQSNWEADRPQDSQHIQREAETLFRRYLKRLTADQPTLILLEDLQWADEQSMMVLSAILQEQHPWRLAVVGAARPLFWDRGLRWGECDHHQKVDLAALARDQARELVMELLQKVTQTPGWLVDLLVDRGGGNPYFTEELVKWLVEQGMIETDQLAWRVLMRAAGDLQVPGTVQQVLQTRIERLRPAARATLERAAVVGLAFWSSAVDFIAGQSVAPSLWRELEERDLVILQASSQLPGEQEYHFKHTLLRDVVYEYTLKKERQQFHRRAAQWLMGVAAERSAEWAAVIASHFDQADEQESASTWYQRAGSQAQKIYAIQAAIGYFQKALDLLSSADRKVAARRMDLFKGLGEMFRLDARFWEATEAYIGVLAAAGAAGDSVAQTHAWHRAFLSLEDTRASVALGSADLPPGSLDDSDQLMVLRLNLLGAVYQVIECHGQADPYMQSTLSLLEEAEDPMESDLEASIQLYRSSLEVAERIGNLGGKMLCLTNLGRAHIKARDYDTALEELLQVLALAQGAEWYRISETYRLLAEVYLAVGEMDRALQSAMQALTWARAVERPLFIGRAWFTLAKVAAASATPVVVGSSVCDASACFANSTDFFRDAGARAERGRTLLVWARHELDHGNPELGQEMWKKGARILSQLGLMNLEQAESQL